MILSKNLRKDLCLGLSALMVATVGAGAMSNVNANASRRAHTNRTFRVVKRGKGFIVRRDKAGTTFTTRTIKKQPRPISKYIKLSNKQLNNPKWYRNNLKRVMTFYTYNAKTRYALVLNPNYNFLIRTYDQGVKGHFNKKTMRHDPKAYKAIWVVSRTNKNTNKNTRLNVKKLSRAIKDFNHLAKVNK